MRFVLLIAILAASSATAFSQATKPKLADLGWLAGCWEMNNEKRGMLISEMWMKPAGDAMIGVGRTLKAGKLIDFEFLRIVQSGDGLAYISRPSANKEDTSFGMIKSTANEIVFENLAHDFPQRILYKREGEKLTARIEGTKEGKTRGVDFSYVRTKCEAAGN